MPKDKNLYFPILVGAIKNYVPSISYQRDDIGDNISSKNPYYNELTAIYWAWKNLKNVDAVGLVHYRRLFINGRRISCNNVLTKKNMENIFKKNDAILPRKRHYYIETNYSHYIHAHYKAPLDKTREIILDKYPEYITSFDKVMAARSAHMFNMFIMKKRKFDQYSKWLFSILGELELRIDISSYSKQEKRVYGYIAELLMDVWIYQNRINFKEVGWMQLGPKKTYLKAINFLIRKFFNEKKDMNTHF